MQKSSVKKDATKRSYSYNIITYISHEDVKEYCGRKNVNNYAFIYHDRDVYGEDKRDEDGNIIHYATDRKEPHFHIIVTFKEARSWQSVVKDFAVFEQNTRVLAVVDLENELRYLTHENEVGKYVYPRECVHSSYGYFRGNYSSAEADNKAFCLIQDIERGLSPLELVRIYGREYVIHRKAYHEMNNLCFGRAENHDAQLLNEYIQRLEAELAHLYRINEENKDAIASRDRLLKHYRQNAVRGNKRVTLVELADDKNIPF